MIANAFRKAFVCFLPSRMFVFLDPRNYDVDYNYSTGGLRSISMFYLAVPPG